MILMKPFKTNNETGSVSLKWASDGWRLAGLGTGAAGAFQLAYSLPGLEWLIFIYLACLCGLTGLGSNRRAFYGGLAVGCAVYAPQLGFFWMLFGPAACVLWLILAFWTGLFLLLGRVCRSRFGKVEFVVMAPFLWTGLEYFRCELYPLRFSWLNPGYAFSDVPVLQHITHLGVYGAGFVLMSMAAILCLLAPRLAGMAGAVIMAGLALFERLPARWAREDPATARVKVAGAQLEFPGVLEVEEALNRLVEAYPQAELLVLSEYTFDGPPPERIRVWCRKQGRYLVAGGKRPEGDQFYNTAFVIGPSGEVVFEQAKSVPIQFFRDGLPAPRQQVWDSPWGKLGLCICYDLSYRRVTDRLVRQGAQALIVPTMDVAEWGAHEHQLHARIAPVRAAEYQLPIFRLASSGISQSIAPDGRVTATAPYPGQGAALYAELSLPGKGVLPWDRWLAPFSVLVSSAWLGVLWFRKTIHPLPVTI